MSKRPTIHLPGLTPDQVAYVQKLAVASGVDPDDPRLDAHIGPKSKPSCVELEAENVRLREALKEIAEHPENGGGFTVGWAFWNVRRIASAALKPAKIRTPAPVPTAREEG